MEGKEPRSENIESQIDELKDEMYTYKLDEFPLMDQNQLIERKREVEQMIMHGGDRSAVAVSLRDFVETLKFKSKKSE